MPRTNRIAPIGIPVHIIQRGNNRQACFLTEQDFGAYIKWLKKYASKFNVEVHAWVLMTNHVHLLCTPRSSNAISEMMQSLGRVYVRYFNTTYQRTGTLWEGRFKSCLVQSETYLLQVYRYIELNPVRANMVDSPADYKWSSYQINALGKHSTLCTPHEVFLALGDTEQQRRTRYQPLFEYALNSESLKQIRQATHKGTAIGNESFISEMEKLIGQSMHPKKMGRPLKKSLL